MSDVPEGDAHARQVRTSVDGGDGTPYALRGVPAFDREGMGDAAGVRAWARAAGDRVRMRLAKLAPGPLAGTLEVPWPTIAHEDYKAIIKGRHVAKRVDEAPVEDVPIKSITGAQGTVNVERLEHYLAGAKVTAGKRGPNHGMLIDLPVVVRTGGKSYLHDGNHRTLTALLKGHERVRARVVDLG